MSNTITIELCAEDRARLDRLTAALEGATPNCSSCAETVAKIVKPDSTMEQLAAVMANASDPTEAPQKPQDEPKAEAKENTQPAEETATAPEPVAEAAPETEKPAVTLEQIHQKAMQLATIADGTKKAAVREIVNTYAKRISDLPEDKWPEIWDKLLALESEG